MAVTVATFKVRFPEFVTIATDRVTLYLGDAEASVNRTQWGSKADMGVAYLAAHLLASDNMQGQAAPGPVQSESVGEIAASYAVSLVSSRSEYAVTSYGRRYLELRSLIFSERVI